MDTKEKEKKPLTPAERRRREEIRQKRIKKRRQKKILRAAVLIGLALVAIAVLGGIIYGISRLAKSMGKGEAMVEAQGDNFVIALDAGHGGADTGLTNDVLEEKEVTFEIVSKLKVMLEGQGYQVVLIREDDSRISKEERAQAVNASGADLVVSVHLNYSEDPEASGVETYYKKGSAQGAMLAQKVLDAVAEEAGAAKGTASEGSFTILENTEIPAVLVEAGYASNAAEAGSLAEDIYRDNVAKGIAKGVIRCLARDKE